MGLLDRIFGPSKPKVQPTHLDDENFDAEVLQSDLPVVVDFWSPSCGPCKTLEPIIVGLATDFAGQVKVAEANTQENARAAARFGVRATPTVLYFKGGKVVERVVGFRGSLYHREIIETDLLADGAA
jgi:thioredoxin 1